MTAPQIPDAAVGAYLRATARSLGLTGAPAARYVAGAHPDSWEVIRAGLAAALPHLLPAAPSGETAPGGPCAMLPWTGPTTDGRGEVETYGTDGGVALAVDPTGYGASCVYLSPEVACALADGLRASAARARAGVTAAPVPARTNAQATADVLPLSEIQAELDGYASARERLGRADEDHPGAMDTAEIRAMDAAGSLAEAVLHAARRAAAPSGETAPPTRRRLDELAGVLASPALTAAAEASEAVRLCYATAMELWRYAMTQATPVQRDDQADGAVTVHLDNRTGTFTPTTEPAGEVDRG